MGIQFAFTIYPDSIFLISAAVVATLGLRLAYAYFVTRLNRENGPKEMK